MIPGPGVQTPEVGVGEVGSVQLISVEKVPSHCWVVVDAMVEGCQGSVFVEPSRSDCAE